MTILPNRNRIDIRLRRARRFYFDTRAHHKESAEHYDQTKEYKNGNRNDYFGYEFHIRGTQSIKSFCTTFTGENR